MIYFQIIVSIILFQNVQEPNQELRAAMFLGARSAKLQITLPVVQQVVLVPDEATYLDEISRWSTKARWPILFDQEPFVSQFVRRFSPEKIWRRDSVGKRTETIEKAMQRAVAMSWDGSDTVEEILTTLKLPPLGVVFTSPSDSARTGAVALAAGRGQLLKFISADWGDENKILSQTRTNDLVQEIDTALQSTGVNYKDIGDTIDAITLCQTMPARVDSSLLSDNPVAISDVICRDSNGKRFAWSGWVFGSKAESTYLAMCSLFLQRDSYWFCNTYPNNDGWSKYGFGNILQQLPNFNIKTETIDGTLTELQQAGVGGVTADVMYFTSKGNQDFLDMKKERTAPTWLPILNTPSALYFLHSWSLKNPTSPSTVGGTWLSRGVYAYVGSSHEPMLTGFVPPILMLQKTVNLVPFLVASRWLDGESMYSKTWRINTIGDPLMLCPPANAVPRVKKTAKQLPDYKNVTTIAKKAMQLADESPSDESFAEAIKLLITLGQDEMSGALWLKASRDGVAGASTAKAVLPALFRLVNTEGFLLAFSKIRKPSRFEQDMLWQFVGRDPSTPLRVLIDNLRSPYELDDILVIRKRIEEQLGINKMFSIVGEKLQRANGRNKRGLERLLKKYND